MSLNVTQTIQSKADNFSYITLKLQADMYEIDNSFYGIEHTTQRVSNCILACVNKDMNLLAGAKEGLLSGFNRLKNEENLPIISYDTIENILKLIDEKSKHRSA